MATELTQERLRELLHYDETNGTFIRRKAIKGYRAGSVAGTRGVNGYIQVVVDGYKTYAHRLAIFYMTGEWPPHDVDHINGDRADNRWTNLRAVTRAQNMWNMDARGAHKCNGRWRVQMKRDGQLRHVGMFDTREEAEAAYRAAAQKHGFADRLNGRDAL